MKIGIDLGGSHIAIGVINTQGRIVEKVEKRIMAQEKKNIKVFIEDYIVDKVTNFKEKYQITSIGIAIPGTVTKKEIVKSVNLNIFNYPIAEILEEKLQMPVQIRNDAKCAAIAENQYGSLKNYERSLFLTLGTGIGGAVFIDNKLLNTGELPGCEFGHMIIQKQGIPCNCGKQGCFEKYSSMKALKNNLRKELGLDEKTRGEELLTIIRNDQENPKVKKVIDEFIENLAIGISNLINIFEPEAIAIGGSFVFFEEVLLHKLKEKLQNEKYLFNQNQEIVIVPAVLGNDAGMIGSLFG